MKEQIYFHHVHSLKLNICENGIALDSGRFVSATDAAAVSDATMPKCQT